MLVRSAAGNGCRSSKNLSRIPPSSVQKSQREDIRESSASQIKLFMQSRCVVMFVGFCVCVLGLFVPLFF